jgi:methylamine dehydrogenase heavy chain
MSGGNMITFHRQPMIGQQASKNRLARKLAIAAMLVATYPVFADVPTQLGAEATSKLLDEPTILKAPPSDSKRIYVLDSGHFNMTSTIYTVDGKSTKLLGMIDANKLPHVMASSNGDFLAVANTMYSRVASGKRDDFIQLFDTQTFNPIADIDIPEGRFLTGVLERLASLSVDNKHLLFQQFSPSPAVGLVDLEKKSFVKMIDVPDCYHIFPTAKQNFFMHCRDGSLLQVTYDSKGNTKQKPTKVFHAENEYLHNNPYYSNSSGHMAYTTYEGRIFQANLSESGADFMKPIDVFTDKEKSEQWRPGGWQTITYHKARNELYLLADKRAKWTHKLPSRFVFVVDATTGKRLRRIDLKHEIDSIAVSQDNDPYLYAVSAETKSLYTFDARSGKQLGQLDELGKAPTIIITMDK